MKNDFMLKVVLLVKIWIILPYDYFTFLSVCW